MNTEILKKVLGKSLGTPVTDAVYHTEPLQGGTLGDVRLVSGEAVTSGGETRPYRVVHKRQKKWARDGDPASWRREYDLYSSDLGRVMDEALRWPLCYDARVENDAIELWMEYIQGVSGESLTCAMLEEAGLELGRFQGRILKDPSLARGVACLGDTGFTRREYAQLHTQQFTYEYLISPPCRMPEFLKQMLKNGELIFIPGKSFEYGMLRSPGCDLPAHLKQMLIDADERSEAIFRRLDTLPTVLCHRDFWVENIFHTPEGIRLIDWDTTGWGSLGEDVASLAADADDFDSFEETLKTCVPAYLRGVAEFSDISGVDSLYLRDQILLKFGWRMMQSYMFTQSPDEKAEQVKALQKVYEMRNL